MGYGSSLVSTHQDGARRWQTVDFESRIGQSGHLADGAADQLLGMPNVGGLKERVHVATRSGAAVGVPFSDGTTTLGRGDSWRVTHLGLAAHAKHIVALEVSGSRSRLSWPRRDGKRIMGAWAKLLMGR